MKKRKSGLISNVGRSFRILKLMKKHKLIRAFMKLKDGYKKGLSPKEILSTQENLKEIGKRMTSFFQDAGPAFIKFGQLLSTQVDIIPKEIYHELENLQDNVPRFPFSQAKQIIEKELEDSVENLFQKIDEEPIAAGSLAQVHIAKLKSGKVVAIKVQRPDIEKEIYRDIQLIRFFAGFVDLEKINLTNEYFQKILKEFEDFLEAELNFEAEGKNMDIIRDNIEEDIIIPEGYDKYTTKKVLTMEWVSSHKITNLKKLKEFDLDKDKIIKKVLTSFLTQMLKHGVYHADPHPANIGFRKNGDIVLYDFGVIGSINKEYRESMMKMVQYVKDMNGEKYFEEFLKANKIKKREVNDYDLVVDEINEILEDYSKSIIPDYAQCMAQLAKAISSHGILDMHKYVLITRTLITLISISKIYGYSNKDALQIFEDVAKDSMKRNFWDDVSLTKAEQLAVWANKNIKEFVEEPKKFLEENLPVFKYDRDKEDKEEEDDKKRKTIEDRYRSFGLYKYPFFALLFAIAGLLTMKFYPQLAILKFPLYQSLFYISAGIIVFTLFYIIYLDLRLDKRTEIYKYPFFAFFFFGLAFYLTFRPNQPYLFGIPSSIYIFTLSIILMLISLYHLVRILKYKLLGTVQTELSKKF